jgi:prepilin-type N-terminal cleavage/methylation domain-containing protein
MQLRSGFTLIELLVVIAIIGILATLVITQLSGAQTRAQNSNAKSDVLEMGKAIETWKSISNTDNAVNARTATTGVAGTRLNGDGSGSICGAGVLRSNETCGGWATLFNQASGAYPVRVSKTPSTSHTYGYNTKIANPVPVMTTFTSDTYCLGTSTLSPAGGTNTESAFWVANGVTVSGTAGAGLRAISYAAGICS